MNMSKYAIGMDYGTLSVRGALIDLESGKEAASAEYVYPHAILTDEHFSGITLEKAAAFQHPQDYLDGAADVLGKLLQGISPADVVGIGLDFTACTVIPVDENAIPLCFLPQFANEPHAYAKLWKHHGAQKEADAINALAARRGETFPARYGGKVDSEWLFPKILETLNKAPAVYEAAARFMEAGDWMTWMLTGREVHGSCMAGYKACWSKKEGFPGNDFLTALDPRLDGLVGTKVSAEVFPTGQKCGEINTYGAALTGLAEGTAVAAPIIDAHSALPAAGVVKPGMLMMILGTSGCYLIMDNEDIDIPGIGGRVEDGTVPGYVAYEAGQGCMGDCFDWMVKNFVPASYAEEAKAAGKNIFALLDEKAQAIAPGESGILVLDWFNGNRSPLADGSLTGGIFGITLSTRPEEIYRGLVESVAFGAKMIVDNYLAHGIAIDEIRAAGGISQKNAFLMQTLADVLGREIRVAETKQAGALGSAVLASVAGGYFADMESAAEKISDRCPTVYTPDLQAQEKLLPLYGEYCRLVDYFGRGGNDVLRKLHR